MFFNFYFPSFNLSIHEWVSDFLWFIFVFVTWHTILYSIDVINCFQLLETKMWKAMTSLFNENVFIMYAHLLFLKAIESCLNENTSFLRKMEVVSTIALVHHFLLRIFTIFTQNTVNLQSLFFVNQICWINKFWSKTITILFN